jgi:hypothetical protein
MSEILENADEKLSTVAIYSRSAFRLSICNCRPLHSCQRKSNSRRMPIYKAEMNTAAEILCSP